MKRECEGFEKVAKSLQQKEKKKRKKKGLFVTKSVLCVSVAWLPISFTLSPHFLVAPVPYFHQAILKDNYLLVISKRHHMCHYMKGIYVSASGVFRHSRRWAVASGAQTWSRAATFGTTKTATPRSSPTGLRKSMPSGPSP